MSESYFDERLDAVCAEMRRTHGLMLSRDNRARIEAVAFSASTDEARRHYEINGDPGVLNGNMEGLEAIVETLLPMLAAVKRNSGNKRQSSRPRSLERRLYLYSFITGHEETVKHRTKYGSWDRLAQIWNAAHPNDPMTSNTLARQFNRAKADPVVEFNVLVQEYLTATNGFLTSMGPVIDALKYGLEETNTLEASGEITSKQAGERRQAIRGLARHLEGRRAQVKESLSGLQEEHLPSQPRSDE